MIVSAIIEAIESDKVLQQFRNKILSGKGTFKDTFAYNNRAAELLGAKFSEKVLELSLDDRVTACMVLLKNRYDDIMPLLDAVQKQADKKNRLSLTPKRPPFNAERAEQIGTSLRDLSVSDERIQRRAQSAPETATRAMHDDYIEKNAEFRSSAGIKCYITRITDGKCCEWCSSVAGRYEYGTEPEGIFRRHDNCGCSVTYENGRERQDVWSKKTWEVPDEDAGAESPVMFTKEQAEAAGAPPPKVFTQEEAKKLEAEKLRENKKVLEPNKVHNSSIDKTHKRDIIKADNLKMSADSGFSLSEKQYEVKEDKKQVEESFKYAKEVLGVGNVKFDKLKNNEVIQPMLEQINNLKTKHKKSFSQIFVDDTMSDADFAMVSPDLSLHLNAKYMNSSEATAEFLLRMKKKKLLPKDFENTDYLITHEYMHFISRTEVDNKRSKAQKVIPDFDTRKKTGVSKNSVLSANEYAADAMAIVELGKQEDYQQGHWTLWNKIYKYFFKEG